MRPGSLDSNKLIWSYAPYLLSPHQLRRGSLIFKREVISFDFDLIYSCSCRSNIIRPMEEENVLDLNEDEIMYHNITSDILLLSKRPFDAELWKKFFDSSVNDRSFDIVKKLRVLIIKNTLHLIELGRFVSHSGSEHVLSRSDRVTKCYDEQYFTSTSRNSKTSSDRLYNTRLSVMDRDCIEVSIELASNGGNVCVLNMANANTAGGGYLGGAGAQGMHSQ